MPFNEKSMGKDMSYVKELAKRKSKFGIAVVSNCGYTGAAKKRLSVLQELISTGLEIDAYGSCFGRQFDYADVNEKISEYKFFFSFENSYHCNDYITEKFFNNALLNNVVAVAWGGKRKNYEDLAPPGSFIFAEDFKSMAHLAAFLQILSQDDEGYAAYFR